MSTHAHRSVSVVCSLLAGLVGCMQRRQEPHDLEWYHAHLSERNSKATWCAADLARQADPDCLNSLKAQELWGSTPEDQQKPIWQQGKTATPNPPTSP
jgi:hypothetical protein